MKIRASLITFIAIILFAGNAFAVNFDLTTSFDGWNNPVTMNADAAAIDLTFSNDWVGADGWVWTDSPASIRFGDGGFVTGASQFGTHSYGIGTLTITFDTSDGSLLSNVESYFHALDTLSGTSYSVSSAGANMVSINLLTDSYLHFYVNSGFESLISMTYLDFMPAQGAVVALDNFGYNPVATPIPGAAWLLGSGLIGLVGLRRRFKA